ncbi:17121_t:CDS:2, partial [Dentiscutata erythropus]
DYAAPNNKSKKDRENRLKRRRQAKYMHYQKEGFAGPLTKTRFKTSDVSKTSKVLSETRSQTKAGQKKKQQKHRASISEEKKIKNLEKRKKAYKKKKKEQFEQFYKIRLCNLDKYKKIKNEENNDEDDNDDNDDGENDDEDDNGDDKLCCMNGEVLLAPLLAPLPAIYKLFIEKDPISKLPFVKQAIAYNQVFAFTSIGTNSCLPNQGEPPQFFQIYFHDPTNIKAQIDRKHEIIEEKLNKDMLKEIQEELMEFNPFANTYIQAGNVQASLIYILIHNMHGRDIRQYNLPTTNEVVAICFTDTEMRERDIRIYRYDEKFQKIFELNGVYDPLQYLLLFPSGEYGWHSGILRRNKIQIIDEKITAADKECLEKESQKKLSKNIPKDSEISKIEAEGIF